MPTRTPSSCFPGPIRAPEAACSATSATWTARRSKAIPPGPAAQPRQGARTGFTFYVAPELEFFYFAHNGNGPPIPSTRQLLRLTTSDVAGTLRKRTIQTLETMGIPSSILPRDSPSQHEIDLRHTDALTCRQRDDVPPRGSGGSHAGGPDGHLHAKPMRACRARDAHPMSLFEGDENAFYDAGTPTASRRRARGSSPVSCATPRRSPPSTNQTVNSYKRSSRLRGPVYVSWPGTTAPRWYGTDREEQGRLHPHRVPGPDPACNPYLPSPSCWRRACGHRGGYDFRRGPRQRLRADREERAPKGRPAAAVAVRPLDSMERSDWWPKPSVSNLRMVPAQQAQRVAGVQEHGDAFELDRYLRML